MGKDNKNKGFTLIELVISVAILAIVTAPFLNSFVIAAKNNAAANAKQKVINYSESVMEKFKATSFEMLTEEFTLIDKAVITDHMNEKYYYYDPVDNCYVFSVPGTELTGASSSDYRVDVKMTPHEYDAPNLADVDGTKTAMLISEAYRYDELAQIELRSQASSIADGSKYTAYRTTTNNWDTNLINNIKREVFVYIRYDSSNGTVPYTVEVDVKYSCQIGSSKTIEKVYNKLFTYNYEEVPDVLMFYTVYPNHASGYKDVIYIENFIPDNQIIAAGKKCKVYISNQKISSASLNYSMASDSNIVVSENGNKKNIYADSGSVLRNTEVYLSESIGNNTGVTNSLVGKRKSVKMYEVKVDVYWNNDLASSITSSTDGQN